MDEKISSMEEQVTQAANFLKNGDVVSLPTETVYSLSANAADSAAVDKIYKLKGRKQENPLALLVSSAEQAKEYVQFNEHAEKLAEAFFPGPLTLVLNKREASVISSNVNEGLETLAVRMPNNNEAIVTLALCNFPVVGTSANPSGMRPAASKEEVQEYFGDRVDFILDSHEPCAGIASTVLDISTPHPVILREGAITKEHIEAIIKVHVRGWV